MQMRRSEAVDDLNPLERNAELDLSDSKVSIATSARRGATCWALNATTISG